MNSKDYNHSVDLYSGRLLWFVRRLLQDDDSAADVSQNCFMRLWENLDKVEVDKAKSWLFTVAYCKSLQLITKQKKKEDLSALDSLSYESPIPDLKDVIERFSKSSSFSITQRGCPITVIASLAYIQKPPSNGWLFT